MIARPLAEGKADAYARDGYLGALPILDPGETARFLAFVEELEDRCGGSLAASHLVQPQLWYGWAYELATHPVLLDAVESLLGLDILIHSASIFSKGAHTREKVDWHQDGSYWNLSAPAVVTAWVALTDSTPENGCLRVIPGSHASGRMPFSDHLNAPDRMLLSGLRTAEEVDETTAVDLVLRPGEASFHNVETLHGSAANSSDAKRVGMALRFVPPTVSQPKRDYEALLARGRDDYGHYPLKAQPPTATIAEVFDEHLRYSQQVKQEWLESHRGDALRA